ncbi:Crp/Fnr family transcriptional regulator [Novosphingobium sp. AP12]|uniref:Crp/Fnr family transcriptional regulator n=1 Tax=Novosphingobium sp. AP12 TaxID=1144305 RepID=UPI000271E318|nr:Crp/Fnr family transcriptional regulator [Novosphingobium sp. AP12]EJL20181.1 cAMP-binding protein [Novosphingobium sp. AP12]
MSSSSKLQPMLDKLLLWLPLDASDQAAVLALPHTAKELRAHDFIVREDETPTHSCLLLSGYVYRHKSAGNGGRQIFSIHMKGDVVDLHSSILRRADHNVQAMTPVEVALIPSMAIRAIAADYPQVGQAMWYETLVDAAIFREWTLNVGRRDARARTAHLLCEFALRLKVAGLADSSGYDLPMTQDQLADALALTNVHVNRMLRILSEAGLIERDKRSVRILDFAQLARIGDFDSRYLHLDRIEAVAF